MREENQSPGSPPPQPQASSGTPVRFPSETPWCAILSADSELNLVYVFEPGAPGKAPYKFVGTRFGDEGFRKLGGVVVDAKNRLYIADGKKWEVRRYLPL